MLKNFTVIEINKETPTPAIIIEATKLRLTRGSVETLGYAPFVRFLFDASTKCVAVQVTTDKDKQHLPFSKPEEKQKALAVICRNSELLEYIWGMMPEWTREVKYKANGIFSKEDQAIIFDLKKAQSYTRRSKKASGADEE